MLPVATQCKLLAIACSTAYYKPKLVPLATLDVMHRNDLLFLDHPFMGSRMLAARLRLDGIPIGGRRVRTLMRGTGIAVIYCRPSTGRKHPDNPAHRYQLTELSTERANQV